MNGMNTMPGLNASNQGFPGSQQFNCAPHPGAWQDPTQQPQTMPLQPTQPMHGGMQQQPQQSPMQMNAQPQAVMQMGPGGVDPIEKQLKELQDQIARTQLEL